MNSKETSKRRNRKSMKRTRKNKKNLIGLNSKHRQIVRERVK